jgi:ubiquinone/menaquinone biosynthesis C-methylase UbiE/uncharacterized protein YbaR (Trm112 family)
LLADVVMSTGTAVAQVHPGYEAIADRLVPFFPPVDLDRFAPRPELRAEVRATWGIPEDALVVGCVANINSQKGIIELVAAFVGAKLAHPDTRLVLVGAEYATHAAYSNRLRAQIAADGLVEGRDVVFLGERADVERQLAGMDVIALAAVPRSEGITTAVLEGMAAGLPVVVTDVGALREAVDDGRTGFVIQPGDRDAFAASLDRLLGDPLLRARMGHEARRVANERFGVEACADAHVRAYARALAAHGQANSLPTLANAVTFVCPVCRGPLQSAADAYMCHPCRRTYPIVDGIPIFLPDDRLAEHDEIDHLHSGQGRISGGDAHKAAQAQHFDRAVAEEFEITRPHGTPRLYRFLLREKFGRATAPIGPHLVGASALTVCGGSGMDAEFLARAGARVVASDISLGAARRTQERARRYGLDITPIVADVERLPFAGGAFDVVLVHDGLHHLEQPQVGLAEMTRVARQWVSVTEPARAVATSIAVRAGAALEREASGNRVARLTAAEVTEVLRTAGFRPIVTERYAMYYRHEPGRVFQLLSRGGVFPFVRAGWRVANALIGQFGNKMVVVAERDAR